MWAGYFRIRMRPETVYSEKKKKKKSIRIRNRRANFWISDWSAGSQYAAWFIKFCTVISERTSSDNTSLSAIVSGHSNLMDDIYIHGSVHRNFILIRSNKMQQYAGIYLLQNYSTCFGCLSHPSSGVHKIVTAASGTGHNIRVTTFLQRGLIRRRWRKVVTRILWPVPEAAVTVLCTPDDGCDGHPKHIM